MTQNVGEKFRNEQKLIGKKSGERQNFQSKKRQ